MLLRLFLLSLRSVFINTVFDYVNHPYLHFAAAVGIVAYL